MKIRRSRALPEDRWPPLLLGGVRVLVVEDDDDQREFLVALLGAAGAVVRSAAAGGEALATLAWWRPAVLVSDLGLPDGDGYALLEAVRAQHGADRLPAVAVTGQSAPADRRRALRAGFQAHLVKPADPDRLILVIAGLARTGTPVAVEPAR